jgi:hypothetical protein
MSDEGKKTVRVKTVGQFEDPDLVPVMNLVCVLIPLVLWTTTWLAFGQISTVRGSSGQGDPKATEVQRKLRLVAVITQKSITLMADRSASAEVMPPDTETGTTGRVDIPHVSVSLEDIRRQAASCSSTPDAPFDDCAYWRYLERFVGICWSEPPGAVQVPDLKAFNLALRGIHDRAAAAFPGGLSDQSQINVKSEDDVPYCRVVALMDFARFRRFEYDWRTDEEFKAGMDEALGRAVADPLLDPPSWNDAMRRELLFPIVAFVN